MGLLSQGTPLAWNDSLPHLDYVKLHGILQVLNLFKTHSGRENDHFYWGDEIEHIIITLLNTNNHSSNTNTPTTPNETESSSSSSDIYSPLSSSSSSPSPSPSPTSIIPTLSLRAHDIIASLENANGAHFLPEWGRFMVEAIPGLPYGNLTTDLLSVEPNMRLRRKLIREILRNDERLLTFTNFPLLGALNFTPTLRQSIATVNPNDLYEHPELYETQGSVADSDYLPDVVIGAHPRFATLELVVLRGLILEYPCIRIRIHMNLLVKMIKRSESLSNKDQ
jgi:hypothetical protein